MTNKFRLSDLGLESPARSEGAEEMIFQDLVSRVDLKSMRDATTELLMGQYVHPEQVDAMGVRPWIPLRSVRDRPACHQSVGSSSHHPIELLSDSVLHIESESRCHTRLMTKAQYHKKPHIRRWL
jgi:hypothetical protein